MNNAQTSLAAAILADFDNPQLTELDLCERHALTLDALLALAQSPPFRHALATLRAVREARASALLARARLTAARVLALLSDRDPASLADAREIRLALKDLLRLLTPGDPATPTTSDATRNPAEPASLAGAAEAHHAPPVAHATTHAPPIEGDAPPDEPHLLQPHAPPPPPLSDPPPPAPRRTGGSKRRPRPKRR